MTENTTTAASGAATQPEAIGLALDVLREMMSDPDQRLDQCPARMARANQAARALAGVQAASAAQEAEPATSGNPPDCDPELYAHGVSVGLFDVPKWTAEALCRGISAATGARVDWHYVGGRVHVKALPALPAPRPQADAGAVPVGCRLVPAKATQEILDAIRRVVDLETGDPEDHRYDDGSSTAGALYEAILAAAAPPAPAAPAQDMESVLIHGVAYLTPAPVAAELLRLHLEAMEAPAAPTAAAAPLDLRELVKGMSVSVDVSTGDEDAGHRYFGEVTEVQEDPQGRHGLTLLVQDAEPNFAPTPAAGAAPSQHITQPYTVAEIRERVASGDYNAELMLQHALLYLGAGAAPTDAEIGQLFADETGFLMEPQPAAIASFARAVLARWGAAAPAQEAADGWMPIETAPEDQAVICAAEFGDRPDDWRIKVGYLDSRTDAWTVWGASWTPSKWRPLPPPPAARARQEGQA